MVAPTQGPIDTIVRSRAAAARDTRRRQRDPGKRLARRTRYPLRRSARHPRRQMTAAFPYGLQVDRNFGQGDPKRWRRNRAHARSHQDQQWVDALLRARGGERAAAPIVAPFNGSLAERAVPEWRTTIDALQSLPEIGADARSDTRA